MKFRDVLTVLLLIDVVGAAVIAGMLFFSDHDSTAFVAWLALASAFLALLELHLMEKA